MSTPKSFWSRMRRKNGKRQQRRKNASRTQRAIHAVETLEVRNLLTITMGVSATVDETVEGSTSYGQFSVERDGYNPSNLASFSFTITGTASLSSDFSISSSGASYFGITYYDSGTDTYYGDAAFIGSTVDIFIQANTDGLIEGTEAVTLTLTYGSETDGMDPVPYTITESSAEVEIIDIDSYSAAATVQESQIGLLPSEEITFEPPTCNCSCSCDDGTIDDFRLLNSQSADAVLIFTVTIPKDFVISDTLTLSGTFGGSSVSSGISLATARDSDEIEIPFQLAKSSFGGALLADYSITMSSSGGALIGGSQTFEGKVSLGKQGLSPSHIMQGELVTGGIVMDMGDGTATFFADDGVGGYDSPSGELGTLTAITGGYQFVSKWGHTYVFDTNLYQTSRTQSDGRETTYGYTTISGQKKLTSVVGDGNTITLSYSGGAISSISDTTGNSLSMTYTGSGQVNTISRVDPDGAGPLSAPVTTYAYNGSDQITSVTAPGGLVTSYTYDSTGRLATVTSPDGSESTYVSAQEAAINGDPSLTTATDASGVTSQYKYDKLGNVIREVDGEGNETIYERDANGLATKITYADPDGAGPQESAVYEYTYDSRGNMLTETLPDSSVRTWVYHTTWNKPVQYTDANGNITLYEYDSTYKLLLSETSVIDEIDDLVNLETDDLTTSYTYTPAPTLSTDAPMNLLASVTAPDGVVTEFEYDEDGNLTKTTFAVGTADEAYTTATYDSAGNKLTGTDELGNTSTYTYDALNRVTSITSEDPDGAGPVSASTKSYTYNAMGLVATESFNSRTTTYAYDSSGRLTSVTEEDPDDTGPLTAPVTSYTYDTDGNILTITDPLGNVTTFAYTDGLLTSVTEADPDGAGPLSSPVTSYTYNDNGQVLTVTDPLSRVTTYEYDDLGRQISVTYPDPDGAGTLTALSETTEYDLFGRVASRTDTAGVTTTYTYDHEGNLLTETTPLGTTMYTYDELNRQVEVETADPDGAGALNALVTVYVYNAAGMLASVTTPVGTTTYAYDYRRRRTSVTQADPDGAGPLSAPVSSTTYDDAGNVLTKTDALGNVTSYEYDALNRVIEITSSDPDGVGALTSPVTSYEYDEFGQLVSITDPNGGVTTYEYDDLGRKITEISPDPDGAGALTAPEVSYEYDAKGQLVSVTDALGNVTTYEYDNLGRQISVTLPDPDGAGAATSPVTTNVYDAAGQLTSVTDPLGRQAFYSYDAMGRRLLVTLPDPDEAGPLTVPYTSYSYGSDGRLASVTDTAGQTVSYTYTSAGQIATMTDPTGVTTYTYDALGRQLIVTEPDPDGGGPLAAPVTTYVYNDEGQLASMSTNDGTTSYEYDDLGRTVKVTMPDPDGGGSLLAAWTVYEYDALGRTLSEADRLGHETSYDYDKLGRLIKKTDAEGGETEYTYDANGNRLTLTDPEENTTTWTYDYLNRMLTNTNELSDTRYYEYDAAGNLVEYTDRNGREIEYVYDNLQRRISENWMDGMSTVHTISYSYDAASQLIEASDSAATYTFTYDRLGRNTSTEHDLAALGFDVVINEAYDALNRRTSLTAEIDGTDDLENTYAYDYLNRMTQVTQGSQSGGNAVAEKRVDFTYDAEDRYQFTSITRYANLAGTETVATTSYGYDYADQLTSLTHVDGGSSTLAGYTYSYDEGNRLTAFTVYGYSAEDATYSYDDTDQLTGADRSGTTSDESYTYDENGNRTGGGYSTGDNNQLLSDGTYNYTYDDEGNRLTKTNISTGEVVEYGWDYRNRLTSITTKDSLSVVTHSVEYTYDAFNRRIVKSIDADGASAGTAVEEIYIYDGLREERGDAGDHILLAFDESGDLTDRFMYGPNVDQVLASEDVTSTSSAGDVLWALTDNLGTVRDVAEYDPGTDTTTVVNHLAYDAFGGITNETNSATDFLFAFTGRERDEESDLQYNRARYYDAELGKWIGEDPSGFDAGDENLTRYVGNGVISKFDPSGEIGWGGTIEYTPDGPRPRPTPKPPKPPKPPKLTPLQEYISGFVSGTIKLPSIEKMISLMPKYELPPGLRQYADWKQDGSPEIKDIWEKQFEVVREPTVVRMPDGECVTTFNDVLKVREKGRRVEVTEFKKINPDWIRISERIHVAIELSSALSDLSYAIGRDELDKDVYGLILQSIGWGGNEKMDQVGQIAGLKPAIEGEIQDLRQLSVDHLASIIETQRDWLIEEREGVPKFLPPKRKEDFLRDLGTSTWRDATPAENEKHKDDIPFMKLCPF